jgi:hypothetical protein
VGNGGKFTLSLAKNGGALRTTVTAPFPSGSNTASACLSATETLVGGDIITLTGTNGDSATRGLITGAANTYLSGHRVY